MKNALIAFSVAFLLSMGFTFLPLMTGASLSAVPSIAAQSMLSTNLLLGTFFSLVGLGVFFAVFYLLANHGNLKAKKSTVLATLLGATLGPAILYSVNILLYPSYFGVYLSMAASSAVSGIVGFFFPALTALLLVELRKKPSGNLNPQ
ncbi:MAG: hypothetical protein NWE93_07435 [Candidatus Bathyarchaeota archaeon]|nr:hypothetical protein [Candidatus Bathyarchaeota archaeon]